MLYLEQSYILYMIYLKKVLIILFYNLKVLIFKDKYDFINIIIFYIVCLICSLSEHIIKNLKPLPFFNRISVIFIVIIFFMYLFFTVYPPKNELFKDKTSGIHAVGT